MAYSKYHKQIVEDLMAGKMILSSDVHFSQLRDEEDFYLSFFKESFGFELRVMQEYAYLVSADSNEMLSRDICIFIAILCYELDREGKNFMDQIKYSEFDLEEVEHYFENSAYFELIQSNKQIKDKEARKNLINAMARRNILQKNAEERFQFTPAHQIFMDFAVELARMRMQVTEDEGLEEEA